MARRLTYSILTAGCIAAFFLIWNAWRNSRNLSDAEMLKRLPTNDAIVVAVDFGQLRQSSLFAELARSRVAEEADYQAFVRDSGFDYKRDLDYALLALTTNANYFVVKGRFDWKRLHAYAQQSGGSCYNDLCHMPGSKPDRQISFLPLTNGVMGLAVSKSETAASQLLQAGPQRPIVAPAQPVWISVPATWLGKNTPGNNQIPGAAGMFASALGGVNELMLTMGPRGDNLLAHMEAQCNTPQDATNLTGKLNALTFFVKGAMERAKKRPDAGDLAGILAAGQFRQSNRMIYADWTLQKAFIDNLAGL